jgi:hypothetical protein
MTHSTEIPKITPVGDTENSLELLAKNLVRIKQEQEERNRAQHQSAPDGVAVDIPLSTTSESEGE